MKRKRILALALSLTLAFSVVTPVAAETEPSVDETSGVMLDVSESTEDLLEDSEEASAAEDEEATPFSETEQEEEALDSDTVIADEIEAEAGEFLAISQSEFDSKLNTLRSQYPNYSTWNDWFDGGHQCFGFARLIGYNVFGTKPSTWSQDSNFDHVKAGDLIQYGNTSGQGHTVFVTAVSGNTITFVDCNGNGNYSGGTKVRSNGVKWDNTIQKGAKIWNKYSFSYLLSSPGIQNGHNPTGVIDGIEGGIHSVTISGWAFDEDDLGASLDIHVYCNGGQNAVIGKADVERADVNEAYKCGNYHGYLMTIELDRSIVGECTFDVYAINVGGGDNQYLGSKTVTITADTEAPVISDCKVYDVSLTGYKVSCKVTDNSYVDRVQFPTWTTYNGQDDIAAGWEINSAVRGVQNGDTFTYEVKISDHNNESGTYNTHIYAYDKYGNCSSTSVDAVEIPVLPAVTTKLGDDFYAKIKNSHAGTVLTKVIFDSNGEWDARFMEDQGNRDAVWHFVRNKGEDTYTIYCDGDEGLALDVCDGKDVDKRNIRVWTVNGSIAEKWYIRGTEGKYYLQAACSNTRVLDTPGGNGGTQSAQLYVYNSGDGPAMSIIKVNPTLEKLSEKEVVASGNYNGHYYQVFDQSMNWSDAKLACEALGGHLVTITDAKEQAFIESLLAKGTKNQYWIGLNIYSNSFRWITGETSNYLNWDTGRPDENLSTGRKRYCGQILNKANPNLSGSARFKWNDINNLNAVEDQKDFFSTDKIGVICEFENVKEVTLTYNANGGTQAPAKVSAADGSSVVLSTSIPVRSGYNFLGWALTADASSAAYQAGAKFILNGDVTLYAVWEKAIGGSCGISLTWSLDKSGILTITGSGAMTNYAYKSAMPWYSYINQIQRVEIADDVTSIGDYAFYGMPKLTTITIADSVKTIGGYAFKNCTALNQVKLPSSLTKLGESAFYGCTGLTSIAIPEGIYTVWAYTFKNCTSLQSVSLPSTLIKLDEAAFYGCSSLKEVAFPKNLSIIGIYCFKNCSSLASVTLPGALTQVREAAFYGTALQNLTIPEGVTVIGKYAFKNCEKMKSVTMPTSLQKIDDSAFYNCNGLTVLNLPNGLASICDYAFRKCTGLQQVSFPESLRTIGESSFYGCTGLSELMIPEGVTQINSYAFKGCTNVYTVTLPSTLESLGESAFYGCTRISQIEIPAGVTSLGAYVFSRCSALGTVVFAGSAPAIGSAAFNGVKANVYYPAGDATWTTDKQQSYGGQISWVKK